MSSQAHRASGEASLVVSADWGCKPYDLRCPFKTKRWSKSNFWTKLAGRSSATDLRRCSTSSAWGKSLQGESYWSVHLRLLDDDAEALREQEADLCVVCGVVRVLGQFLLEHLEGGPLGIWA